MLRRKHESDMSQRLLFVKYHIGKALGTVEKEAILNTIYEKFNPNIVSARTG